MQRCAAAQRHPENVQESPPSFIHLAQVWTTTSVCGGPSQPQKDNSMEALKAKHVEQITALRVWHEQNLKTINSKIDQLRAENHLIRLEKKRHIRTIEDREAQIYHLTKRGSPYSNTPCSLCGRVGENYAEEADERTKDGHDTQQEFQGGPLTNPPPNGKTWLEGPGCYTLPVKDAPSFHHNKCARDNARFLKSKSKPYDDEAFNWRTSDEEGSEKGESGQEDGGSENDDDDEVDGNGWSKWQMNDVGSDETVAGW